MSFKRIAETYHNNYGRVLQAIGAVGIVYGLIANRPDEIFYGMVFGCLGSYTQSRSDRLNNRISKLESELVEVRTRPFSDN